MDRLLKVLGARLLTERVQERGRRTVEGVARAAKISAETINRIEAGSNNVSWAKLRKYADFLGEPRGWKLEDYLREVLIVQIRPEEKPRLPAASRPAGRR